MSNDWYFSPACCKYERLHKGRIWRIFKIEYCAACEQCSLNEGRLKTLLFIWFVLPFISMDNVTLED